MPDLPGTVRETSHERCFDELAACRQTIERQAETIGGLRAELVGAQATISSLTASTGPQSAGTAPEPFTGRLRPLTPWLMTTLAMVAVVVLLAWPR